MKKRLSIFLDSGAFSAYTKKAVIKIDDYVSFIYRNIDIIDEYANLDVLDDAKKTLENQKYMESCGLLPIPVFHIYEDYSYLQYYVDNYDYIALGGMAQVSKNKDLLCKWLDHCFSIICGDDGYPKVKTHGFALTTFSLMTRYPWYSVDSSSWSHISRYGNILIPSGSSTGMRIVGITYPGFCVDKPNHFLRYSKRMQDYIISVLESKNFSLGVSKILTVRNDYILNKHRESIIDKKPNGDLVIERVIKRGVSNTYRDRYLWNIKFITDWEKHFPTYPWRYVPDIKRKTIL